MKRVLITGASGFTGIHLSENLRANGWDVIGTGRGVSSPSSVLIESNLLDIEETTDLIARVQPTHIVHLAGLSFAAHPKPLELFDVNVFGTHNLLRAIEASQIEIEKVILASSANVYGNIGLEVLSEDICPQPVNFYASSKLAMEHMAANWFEKMPIIITRPFNYTGPGQDEKFLIPKIVSHFVDRKPVLTLGNINVARDFSDVRTICESYRLLLESAADSIVVNLCSGTLTTLKEIVAMVSELTGHELDICVNPDFVRPNEIAKLRGSNGKLRDIIGEVKNVDIKETLRLMIAESKI